MTLHILIFISILFITNSLNAMKDIALKHINNKTKTSTKKRNNTNLIDSITKKLLLTCWMHQENLPEDITKQILEYCLLLKNKDFENSTEPFITTWRDFRIPTFYSYLLAPKQMKLMQKLLTSDCIQGYTPQGQVEIHYILPSKEKYKLFLTLPIELRRCLTLLPETQLNLQKGLYSGSKRIINHEINPTMTIEVKTLITPNNAQFFNSKPKSIVPEDKKKH